MHKEKIYLTLAIITLLFLVYLGDSTAATAHIINPDYITVSA
jgi:hypothetical protein